MCQIVSCQESSQNRERESRRSELREPAVEGDSKKGITLCQEEVKTLHVL
jgi:hypothetical protein